MRLVYFVRRLMLKRLWSSWSLRGLTSTEWWVQKNHHHMTWFISSSWPSRSSSSLWPQRSWPGLPCWEVVWQERFVGVNSQKVNDLMLVSVLHVKNLNEGGEVWTYWCPMQQSTPTLDPSLAALKRFHGGRILGNNVTFSRLGTRSSKSTWKRPSFSSRWMHG